MTGFQNERRRQVIKLMEHGVSSETLETTFGWTRSAMLKYVARIRAKGIPFSTRKKSNGLIYTLDIPVDKALQKIVTKERKEPKRGRAPKLIHREDSYWFILTR